MRHLRPLIGAFVLVLLAGVASATTRTKTDELTSRDGGPVAFPGGIDLTTYSSSEPISPLAFYTSAYYVGFMTAGANVDGPPVKKVTLKYERAGNYVHVWGQVSIDPVAGAATATTFTLTTPVVRSANFSGTLGATGTAGLPAAATNGVCSATNGAKTVSCTYGSGGTSAELVNVNFTYTISGN